MRLASLVHVSPHLRRTRHGVSHVRGYDRISEEQLRPRIEVSGGRPVWRMDVQRIGQGPFEGRRDWSTVDVDPGTGEILTPSHRLLRPSTRWAAAARRFALENNDRIRELETLPIDWTQPLYIRFGMPDGASGTFMRQVLTEDGPERGDFERRGEVGVSVYGVTPTASGWDYHGLNQREALHKVTSGYWSYMFDMFRRQGRPAYLVQGPRVVVGEHVDEYDGTVYPIEAYGADGEPLLEPDQVRIIAELDDAYPE